MLCYTMQKLQEAIRKACEACDIKIKKQQRAQISQRFSTESPLYKFSVWSSKCEYLPGIEKKKHYKVALWEIQYLRFFGLTHNWN